jgi:DNA-binding transcriptional regulator GbsR (MarR family)
MSPTTPDAVRRFVESWGAMGALWGINRSVAKVHALLIATDGPLALDEIASTLSISKGNASMCLKELRTFGVVRPVEAAGDRRDFWVTEPDVWTMFFRILKERKRREFDPVLEATQAVLSEPGVRGEALRRLRQMSDLLSTVEGVASRTLEHPNAARAALTLVASLPLGGKKKKR